ncbi:hypothetical protein [Hyalangium minutum]|uniref:Uncharacterized protein n=1 Tax=Hyalangium minutum TaxID=394096 RepID=A0A085WXR0_9BACT|nr:hypothetical protein [Hyalangium minutum]KFE72473.1 hypothetical protein DB31_0736 [Hyalangium minutum]
MARIDGGGSRQVQARKPEPKPEVQAKSAPASEKSAPKAKAESKPQRDGFDSKGNPQAAEKPKSHVAERNTKAFNSGARNEINRFAQSSKPAATTNKDGSVTRSKTTEKGKNTRTQELTTDKGKLREAQLKYTNTSTTKVKGGTNEVKNSHTSQSDMFGRTTSSKQREATETRGNTATTKSRTEATDRWGNVKTTKGETTKVSDGDNSKSTSSSVTTDGKGNRAVSNETKTVTKDGNTTTTKTTKNSSGSETTHSSTAKYENGTYTLGESKDWKNQKFNTEKSFSKEKELKPSSEDKGFTQKQKTDKLGNAQTAGNLLGAAGVKKTITKGEVDKSKMHENNSSTDPNTFVGNRYGYSGKHEVTIGADGVNASFNREAKAGLYAETKTPDIKKGEAGYQVGANAKLEAAASVDAKGKLDLNGLDASVNAKVGVTAEASVNGKAQTKSVKVAGVDVNASVEGTAKVSASATAEASGKVKVTRNPPTAIAEGTVGASAVVKAEAEVKASAGPFAVKATGYASAGAEAKATGTIGYEDGKIKLGGSLGAALGVGAGGSVNVEVDVKQIGEMAKNTAVKVADANGDGKLGLDDAKAVANNVKDAAVNTAKNVVDNTKKTVMGWLGW